MEQFSSTRAKQCFGQVLLASALAPVAIEKHGKVTAILASPDFYERAQAACEASASRVLARITQACVEKDRLIRHQRIALDLALLPSSETRGCAARITLKNGTKFSNCHPRKWLKPSFPTWMDGARPCVKTHLGWGCMREPSRAISLVFRG